MAKKNTQLYLDEELVKIAKERKLNLSQITEKALIQNLYPILSPGERMAINFNHYLLSLTEDNQCFLLPFEIKRVKLNHIGIIKHLDVEFRKINLVTGLYGSGKTTLLHSIAGLTGVAEKPGENLLRINYEKGYIELEIVPPKKLYLKLRRGRQVPIIDEGIHKCILLDAPFSRIEPNSNFYAFLEYLMSFNLQIIMTIAKDVLEASGFTQSLGKKRADKVKIIELKRENF